MSATPPPERTRSMRAIGSPGAMPSASAMSCVAGRSSALRTVAPASSPASRICSVKPATRE